MRAELVARPTPTPHVITRTRTVTRIVTRTVVKTRTVKVPVVQTRVVTRTVVKTVKVLLPVPTAEPTATPEPPSGASEHDGVVVTAANLHADDGGDYGPPSGQTFAVVRVTLTNNGDSAAAYNPLDFKLQGASDNIQYDADAFDMNVANTALHAGKILPGADHQR